MYEYFTIAKATQYLIKKIVSQLMWYMHEWTDKVSTTLMIFFGKNITDEKDNACDSNRRIQENMRTEHSILFT